LIGAIVGGVATAADRDQALASWVAIPTIRPVVYLRYQRA